MALVPITLFRGAPGTTQGTIRPVRPGWKPFSGAAKGKTPIALDFFRNSANATPSFGAVGVYGIEMPYDTNGNGVNSSGQLTPGYNPYTSSNGSYLQTGSVVQKIKLSGGVGTGIGLITVIDGGSDVTSAPTVVFTGGGGSSAAATAIIRDRRIVGITITNAGSGYTSAPVITFTGGSFNGVPQAVCGIGQVTTINTNILYAAHSPLAAGGGGGYWVMTVEGNHGSRIVACSTSAVAAFNNADDGALEPEHHIMGTSSNCGFTVATGTNPDGTPTIGVLTLAAGLPNGTIVNVYYGVVRELSAQLTHQGDKTQIKGLDLMYAVVGASGDNSNTQITATPMGYGA